MTFCVQGTFLRFNDYSAKNADTFTSDLLCSRPNNKTVLFIL